MAVSGRRWQIAGDPSVVGFDADIGEAAENTLTGTRYIKTGAANTDWTVSTSAYGGGGAHTHPESEVTGLVSDLAGKSPTSHAHAQSEVTNLVSDLAGKAASSHTHAQSDVTNLVSDLAGKCATTDPRLSDARTPLAHNQDGNTITTGTVAAARLGSGTPSSANFLRGDSTWTAPPGGTTSKDDQYYRQVGTSPLERWYVGGAANNGTPMTTGAPTVNVLRAFRFYSTRGGTLDRIGFQVTTLIASGLARCGIYQATSDTNNYPAGLVVDGGQQLTSTAGLKATTINQALTANTLYWFVYLAGTAAATVRCLALAGADAGMGFDNALGVLPAVGISVAQTYGALPATFPAGGAVITAVPLPAIGVRFSA